MLVSSIAVVGGETVLDIGANIGYFTLLIVTYCDGQNVRDYVYVDDIVRANIAALDKGENQVYNLGWGEGVSVNEIFGHLKKITNYRMEQRFGPPKLGEVRGTYLDASKATRELGWRTMIELGESLRQTVEFCRSLFPEPSSPGQ